MNLDVYRFLKKDGLNKMKTEEMAIIVTSGEDESLNSFLEIGWKVKTMCAFDNASVTYAKILVILEREIK